MSNHSRNRFPPVRRVRHMGLTALLLLVACYSYRVAAPGPVSPGVTEPKGEVLWSFVWGFIQEYPRVDNCQGQGMAEVKASTNLGFALITIATLGLASPMRVEWRCAPPTPAEGRIPPPAPPSPALRPQGETIP